MGGLRKHLPLTFWTFLIGSASLAAFPFVTAGFYSKDSIIWYAWAGKGGGPWLFFAAVAGALLTAIYTFRMVFITFFGDSKTEISHRPGMLLQLPLLVLAVLSIIGGFVDLPETFGNFRPLGNFLDHVLPASAMRPGAAGQEWPVEIISIVASLAGIYLAYILFLRHRESTARLTGTKPATIANRFFQSGWGFDWLYDRLFVRPYIWVSRINAGDFFDSIFTGIAWVAKACNVGLSWTESGQLRLYAAVIAIGAVIAIALAVFL
jgi:NADH-quinone oxidoreductase subunit L